MKEKNVISHPGMVKASAGIGWVERLFTMTYP